MKKKKNKKKGKQEHDDEGEGKTLLKDWSWELAHDFSQRLVEFSATMKIEAADLKK